MTLLPLYLRREPTTDAATLAHDPKAARRRDVVAYADEACTIPKGRWPWWARYKPSRASSRVMLNCYQWRAVWLPDTAERPRKRVRPVAPNGLVLLYQGTN